MLDLGSLELRFSSNHIHKFVLVIRISFQYVLVDKDGLSLYKS